MRFHKQSTYPYPVTTVIQLFSDKDYFLEKHRLTGAQRIQLLEQRLDNGISTITVRRDVSLEIPLPAFARKFIHDTVTLTQTDRWDQTRRTGTLDIHMTGTPAKVTCNMKLSEANSETVLDLDFDIEVNVPLVGQKIAALMARDLDRKFQRDDEKGKIVMAELARRYQ
ncbi:DUF2505 domain-containing protein [Alcanivorax sp. S6407]|uniref:DUF2505 domain-containing protein n=1 Tax=Alcanivorax sp. S6407 TaxID=2926424 RepID=UPI001FF538D4|nr:DUF2505 domain-containing protein [Alcanivorax sp. S6407]MCK0153109.1 DUF2505 domain-containing protein [Alcanivorax sp. S6407]